MQKSFLIGVAAFLAVPAIVGRADYTITAVHTDLGSPNALTTNGNGTIAPTFQMIRFYAESLGAASPIANQGTKLQSVSITMTDLGAGSLVIGGYSGTGTPAAGAAADLFGQSEVSAVGGSYQYKETNISTTNAPKYVSFVNMLGDASTATDNNPNQVLNFLGPTPANTYSNYGYGIKSFSVTYGSTTLGVNATTANGGLGALFAVAVVPFGDSVNIAGQLGGDIDPSPAFNYNFTTSVVLGDADLNGTVGLTDLSALLKSYGTGTTWSQGNFKGSGTTDLTDLSALLKHYGLSSPGALPGEVPAATIAAVPEPATVGLLGLLGLGFLRRKRTA